MNKCIKALLTILIVISTATSFAELPISNIGFNMQDEPLSPDLAFALTTKVIDNNTIRAEWAIADGYYMYRKKFTFTTDTANVSLQPGIYPKGKVKTDEFFGKVETYRKHVSIDIPFVRQGDGAEKLDLSIVSQGCADIGICYPPQKKQVSLTLASLPLSTAAAATAETSSDSFSPIAAIKNLGRSLGFTTGQPEFLPPEQVFIYSAEAVDPYTIKAHWNILDGYYLYRDKFSFNLEDAPGVTIKDIKYPPSKTKFDESFGDMQVYYHSVDVLISLTRDTVDPMPIILHAKYQGCADAGLCYPPQKQAMPLTLPKASAIPAVVSTSSSATATDAEPEMVSEQDQIAGSLVGGNLGLIVLSFFGFGLLLAFTPCVFPMIPILSSIIVGQGDDITTRKAFTISLVYVLAMALTYTVAGIVAGLAGANLQAAFQNPWILGSFSAVFVLLAFSMFGFYDIQMPGFLQSKLTNISNRQKGGSLIGVGVMGVLSALIVGPCVAAPLMGALIYIGQTGDAVLGGLALFALSMGMGAPLLAIGTSAGKLLPKAGHWMDTIKAVFGVMMIAVAIWMLERIVPAAISMALWAALLLVSAIYLGALEPLEKGTSGWRKLWKGLGLIALVCGALVLVGVASGGKDVLQPLRGLSLGSSGGSGEHQELQFKTVKGLPGLNKELSLARDQGKAVMLDFYADWCVSCKEMEKYTFSDPSVIAKLKNVVLLRADVTANDDLDKALLKKYGLLGPPSILFFDRNGKEKRGFRLVGFLEPEEFNAHLDKAKL